MSRNVDKKTTILQCVKSQNSSDLNYTAAEALNHTCLSLLWFEVSCSICN